MNTPMHANCPAFPVGTISLDKADAELARLFTGLSRRELIGLHLYVALVASEPSAGVGPHDFAWARRALDLADVFLSVAGEPSLPQVVSKEAPKA